MTKINGKYNGNLRCELSHPSNSIIYTDAPKDNQGEGKFFSPTDLLAASLASCILTIIGIRANKKSIDIGQPTFEVEKVMNPSPRKVSRLIINIKLPNHLTTEERTFLEDEGRKCPVALSLSAEISQEITFEYV